MVTSRDVAREAGVSQTTVSRTLSGKVPVDERTRQRVLSAVEKLGYVPNVSATRMRTSRSGAIGIVASEILNPYFPRLLETLTVQARERDLSIVLWNDSEPGAPMAMKGIRGGIVDGVIFTAPTVRTTGVDRLVDAGAPVVLVNRSRPDGRVDQVSSDHEASGYSAADYFLRNGRTKLVTAFGPRDSIASPLREKGFRRRLKEADVSVDPAHWHVGETSYEHGWAVAMGIVEGHHRPDALFCSADIIAFGALSAFQLYGIRVPEDIWVMGNDGLPMSAWPTFDLTTHRQPIEEIARNGLDLLVKRINGEAEGVTDLKLRTELIVRGSTANAGTDST